MSAIVSLPEVVDALQSQSDLVSAHLNPRTGEIFTWAEFEIMDPEEESLDLESMADWLRADVLKVREVLQSDEWLQLPSQHEIHEYRMMENFCESVPDPERRNLLLLTIQGKGAFGRFKAAIQRMNLQDEWYRYHDREYERIAEDWLNFHGIPFHRNPPG
ncbi:MAG: hypothetical protein C4524_08655 [Candidatus Zixiibacteriota bacterium]|nr:MAG: hypothetical protein C4524_08655 [candidate division Zixibacteria bacterium]